VVALHAAYWLSLFLQVKSAGRRFDLKDLEDLCTKFLKFRLDGSNLLTFLKAATKYDAPDLKEAVLTRFIREANTVLAQDAVLDLSQEEFMALLETKPSVQAKKLMATLIKWARKRYGYEVTPQKKALNGGDGEANGGETRGDAVMETDQQLAAADPEPEVNLVKPLSPFAQYLQWDRGDAEYFLKTVRNKKVMTEEDENKAMVQILRSFVEDGVGCAAPVRVTLSNKGTRGRPRGPRSLGPATGEDCVVVMTKLSEKKGGGGYIKTEGGY